VILPRHVEGFAKSGAALLQAIKLICRRRPENLIVQKTQLVVEDDEIAGKISVPSQYLRTNCPLRFTIVYHFNVKNDSMFHTVCRPLGLKKQAHKLKMPVGCCYSESYSRFTFPADCTAPAPFERGWNRLWGQAYYHCRKPCRTLPAASWLR
jgi:hypothetical protein